MPYFPEVVRIIAAHVAPAGKAIGTGFFLKTDGKLIKEEGLLLTNAHVVTDAAVVKIQTSYINNQTLPVTVIGVCHDRDLALLKVEPQVLQWLKQHVSKAHGLDHIPAFSFVNSDTLRQGDEVHAVGHPLGLEDQQYSKGEFRGVVHLGNMLRGLDGATINGGNSGGPTLLELPEETRVKVKGLNYWQPSKYGVIGVNTFKLTGANVDGENGFIFSNTVQNLLPAMSRVLDQRIVQEEAVKKMVMNMINNKKQKELTTRSLIDHLDKSELHHLNENFEDIETKFQEFNIGGKRCSFTNWVEKYVINDSSIHPGGLPLLKTVILTSKDDRWSELYTWRKQRSWKAVREASVDSNAKITPVVIRMMPQPPTHIHAPMLGVEVHPIHQLDALIHYQCPLNDKKEWIAKGGVLVSSVAPKSLYQCAGGLEGDLIWKFQNKTTEAKLSASGTWLSPTQEVFLSLLDLCHRTPLNEEIQLSVLRVDNNGNGSSSVIKFSNKQPKYSDLPPIRKIYPYCDEGRVETKQMVNIQGISLTPMRLNHVLQFQKLEYMLPSSHHQFKIIVANVSPESPAYNTANVHIGSIVTHINETPVADNWKGVLKQLATPHPKTKCWVLGTDMNGVKNKFIMLQRNNIIKN